MTLLKLFLEVVLIPKYHSRTFHFLLPAFRTWLRNLLQRCELLFCVAIASLPRYRCRQFLVPHPLSRVYCICYAYDKSAFFPVKIKTFSYLIRLSDRCTEPFDYVV